MQQLDVTWLTFAVPLRWDSWCLRLPDTDFSQRPDNWPHEFIFCGLLVRMGRLFLSGPRCLAARRLSVGLDDNAPANRARHLTYVRFGHLLQDPTQEPSLDLVVRARTFGCDFDLTDDSPSRGGFW